MAEGRSPTLRCWDACLQYELSRAEVWAEVHRGMFSMSDWLGCVAMSSIMEETAIMALRHIACDYLKATSEKLAEVLHTFKREGFETNGDGKTERLSLRKFLLFFEPLRLVPDAWTVLEEVFNNMLQCDKLCVQCLLEEAKVRAKLQLQEQNAREEVVSLYRRWQHTRLLQDRLQQQRMHLTTLHAVDSGGVADRAKVSLIRRAVRVEEERRQQHFAEKASAMERIVRITDTLETLHNQLRIAGDYKALAFAPLLGEQSDHIAQFTQEASRKAHWDCWLSSMERQIGILGRFAVGFSLVSLGRREHDAILRRMQNNSADFDASNAAEDLSWLLGDNDTAAGPNVCAADTDVSPSLLLQQCLSDVSSYKPTDSVSCPCGRDVPSMGDRSEVEGVLRQVFDSLTRLNYVALPFLQGFASTVDTVVLFPSFELFLAQCEMNVIGSSKLAFFRHCSCRLDANLVTYIRSLVRNEGSWLTECGMCFDDFLAFLVDQAAVEYVRYAYLLTPKMLLTKIVTDIVVPKWLERLRKEEIAVTTPVVPNVSEDAARVGPVTCMGDSEKGSSDDLCLLLNTAVTWLGIAGRSLQNFAQAYRTHVLDYPFAMKAESNSNGITTTRRLMSLLFPETGNSPVLRCDPVRWEALRRTQGSMFATLNALVGDDGSLDSLTAWLTVGIGGIDREELMQRVTDAVESILRASLGEDVYCVRSRHKCSVKKSHDTPLSWILSLAVCVRLAFTSDLVACGLDKLFQLLTVST